jgi:hypothetical protein
LARELPRTAVVGTSRSEDRTGFWTRTVRLHALVRAVTALGPTMRQKAGKSIAANRG